jgi:putative ABC transport system permease protein
VAVAAPLMVAALASPGNGRADMWVGLDESALALKPWWSASSGEKWFKDADSVILGCDAAEIELRTPGDVFFSPEAGRKLRVTGVLERSGTSDDSLFFVPLRTSQTMFNQPGRLTAIAVRLRDPVLLHEASVRLQRIPGAQVVTLTEMMGSFLNLVGAVRTLLLSLALVAVAVSVLSVFNTLMAAVLERTQELSVMRAIGCSRAQVLGLIATEALLLTSCGSLAGIVLGLGIGRGIEHLVKHFVPLAPAESLLWPTATILAQCLVVGAAVGILGSIYPAWRASRLQPADALKAET